jgi:hypothetical protein
MASGAGSERSCRRRALSRSERQVPRLPHTERRGMVCARLVGCRMRRRVEPMPHRAPHSACPVPGAHYAPSHTERRREAPAEEGVVWEFDGYARLVYQSFLSQRLSTAARTVAGEEPDDGRAAD